jgi:peptidoglycan/LPS O-acetylase OafA/YrhL
MMLEAKIAGGRDNNFNLLRLIAAACVLVSHAYPISLGPSAAEPLASSLGMTLGTLGVITFFSVSGYFISQSFYHRRSVLEFVIARSLRIYPGLLWVLALTVLILGPAFTKLDLAHYYMDRETLLYIPKNLLLGPLQYKLPGVFDDNPFPGIINGSLWTLVYEVACYAMVAVLGLFGLTASNRRFSVFLLMYGLWYVASKQILDEGNHAHLTILRDLHLLTLPFVIGMTAFQHRHRLSLRFSILTVLAVASLVSYGSLWFHELFVLTWSYGVLYLGFLRVEPLLKYSSLGDYSYGMYIFGFPLEQVIAAVYVGSSPNFVILLSVPLTLMLAVVSWHCVEERALAQKSNVSLWLARNVALIHPEQLQ